MAGIKIAVNRLQKGLFIRLPLNWGEHPFLLSSFKLKTDQQIALIKKLGLEYVILYPDKSDTLPLPSEQLTAPASKSANAQDDSNELTDFELQLKEEKERSIEALKSYRRSLKKTENEFNRSLAQVRSVMAKLSNRPLNALQEAAELVDSIVEQLLSGDNAILHLMGDGKEGENLYYHALNVSILSMIVAKKSNMSAQEIKTIGIGALFHDIGKLKIPSQILRKKGALTPAEKNYLKQHPRYSDDLLSHLPDFPDEARQIAIQHHEQLDGNGYPAGLKEKQIHPMAQLVAVVNAYDSLCHPIDTKKAKIPFIAISHLFKNCKAKYNNDCLGILIKMLGIYPPGSVVLLNSGQVGMVISVNSERLLYPNVLVYDPAVPRTEATIIDLEVADLTIEKAISPSALPDEVFEYLSPRTRISYYFDHSIK